MEKAIPKYPVIFKKHYDRDLREWLVTAFFPTEPANYDGTTMTCYAHIGQHGGASFGFFWSGKKCKPEEYKDLLEELDGIYMSEPDPMELVVYQRMTAKHRDEFRAEVNRIRNRK